MYEQMFSYVFAKINDILDVKNTIKSNESKNTVIGVLDIYGFEIFDNNGLAKLKKKTPFCFSLKYACTFFVISLLFYF